MSGGWYVAKVNVLRRWDGWGEKSTDEGGEGDFGVLRRSERILKEIKQ